ncbi:MAG: putative sugar nucleotidyl transferase [Candidatus Caldarchaeum sp.]
MALCVFEDQAAKNFGPLTDTRAVYELFCGTSTLLQKILKHLSEDRAVYLFTRRYLEGVVRERHPKLFVNRQPVEEDLILVNGCLVLDSEASRYVNRLRKGEALIVDGRIAAARLDGKTLHPEWVDSLAGGDPTQLINSACPTKKQTPLKLITYPWDLLELSPKLITAEASGKRLKRRGVSGKVYCKKDVELEEHVLIDGGKGPVVLDENVVVQAFSKIVGPAYIGPGTTVFTHSTISECSVGPVCRLGGEVESSVFIGYSNKRHYGYLGHSIVGEWVNMGAGTTVSNLKNTYGAVRVNVCGRRVDTRSQFIGSFFGDHVKTSIGCLVSGGLNIGVSSHLYRHVSEDVPAFTIHSPNMKNELLLESALATARRMMARRGVPPSEAYVKMLEHLFHTTAGERSSHGVRHGKTTFYNTSQHP